jgi:hypothetical protein
MSFEIRPEPGVLRVVLSGRVTNGDLSRMAVEIAELEAASPVIPDRTCDLRPVERLDFDFAGVLAIAESRRRLSYKNSFRTAIVADDTVQYGYARMFQTLNDHPQITIRIFPGVTEADAWLGLAP